MYSALILNEQGQLKSFLILKGQPFTIKEKHLFVGFIWNHQYMSPNDYPDFYKDLKGFARLDLKPIEYLLMSINNTYFKPQLNEFRIENETYNLFFEKLV